MKGNEDECHVLISTDETVQVNIAVTHINNSKCEKLLGFKIMIAIDMENICKGLVQNKCIYQSSTKYEYKKTAQL